MKAIILASGIGKRLMPLTKETPKPLINLGGVTILERIIQSLIENKITDIIITTGHLEGEIKEFVKKKYHDLNITYIKNPIYEKTNYIYSLWLTKEAVKNDDVILLHGDLVYEPKLMSKIVKAKKSSVLIKKGREAPEKDFKARIKKGLIKEIGIKVFGSDARFCLPLYKILRNDFEKWVEKMGEFIKKDKVNNYAEDALNTITDKIQLKPVYYDNEFAMEVDDFEDLEKAKNIKNKKHITE